MNLSIATQIENCEQRLLQAILKSDITVLDELLSPELLFINHLGHVMSKQDDISAHQSGLIKINSISLSDQNLMISMPLAIVTVKAHISGSFAGHESENDFRFTRIWSHNDNNQWQIIRGHATIVIDV